MKTLTASPGTWARAPAVAVLLMAQVTLLGWWAATGDTAIWALAQAALFAVAGAALLLALYLGLRRDHLQEALTAAAAVERVRLAADLHDLVGHELALIAVRAGSLQVSQPAVAEAAAQIRAGAEQATLRIRELVDVLPSADPASRGRGVERDLRELVDDARAAGIDVTADLDPLGDAAVTVRLTVQDIVREGLTNASRHAPRAPVQLSVRRRQGRIGVRMSNPCPGAPADAVGGTGLHRLRGRIELLGGVLTAGRNEDGFEMSAVLPTHPDLQLPGSVLQPSGEIAVGPARRLLRAAGLPIAITTVVVAGFYTWAVTGATLEPAALHALSIGGPPTGLPARQAPVRLYRSPPAPPGTHCRVFTDGNFPLGLATYRVCLAGGRLVAIQDLRADRS